MHRTTVLAVAVIALTGHAAAQSVTLDSVVNNSDETDVFDDGVSGFAASAAEDLGVTNPSPGRFVAKSRLRWSIAYSVGNSGPTVALLFRRRVEFDTVFTVNDPDNRGYTLDFDQSLNGELIVLGPTSSPDPSDGDIVARCGFFASFDDDANDGNDTLGLSGLVSPISTSGVADADVDGNLSTIVRVDESSETSLGTFVGTRTFAVRSSTLTAPAGVVMQNSVRGDAALVFGRGGPLDTDPIDQGLDGFGPATVLPGDGLTKTITATFFCNAADVAPPAGILDIDDVDAFIVAFVAGDTSADIVAPFGIVDIDDVDAFIDTFLNGCP